VINYARIGFVYAKKKERFDPVKDEDYWNLINLPEYIDEYGTFLDYFEELLNELENKGGIYKNWHW